MDGQSTLTVAGEPALTVILRRSTRARRMSLRVSRLDGRVTLTLPRGASRSLGEAFLAERANWLRSALAEIDPPVGVEEGVELPVEGRPLRIIRAAGRAVRVEGDSLLIPGRGRAGALIASWLKLRARARVTEAIARHAAMLGAAARRPPGALRLADPRARWGSCAATGDLMLSWRLILAPPEVLDYVVAHEVAHLAQMNHSPAFWAEVARLMPDYGARRDWLRRHGTSLHRYSFQP